MICNLNQIVAAFTNSVYTYFLASTTKSGASNLKNDMKFSAFFMSLQAQKGQCSQTFTYQFTTQFTVNNCHFFSGAQLTENVYVHRITILFWRVEYPLILTIQSALV